MLITEKINDTLIKHYSDAGFMIHKKGTDEYYEDAIDLIELNIEYEETDIKIETPDGDPDALEYIEAAKILLGETENE